MVVRHNFVAHARHYSGTLLLLLREGVPSIAFLEFNETRNVRLLVHDTKVVVNL
jgi:hypothetical protein